MERLHISVVFVFVFVFSAVVGVLCYVGGFCDGQRNLRILAIEKGVAEWYADPKTGVRELRWKCGETAE